MRSILSIIALFSCCTLAAQEYIPTYGRELPRGEVIAYPTAQEAAAASAGALRLPGGEGPAGCPQAAIFPLF